MMSATLNCIEAAGDSILDFDNANPGADHGPLGQHVGLAFESWMRDYRRQREVFASNVYEEDSANWHESMAFCEDRIDAVRHELAVLGFTW